MEDDMESLDYEEDLTCAVPYWEVEDGCWYIPYPVDVEMNVPEVLENQEMKMNTIPITTEIKEQDVQTDDWTQDKRDNTNEGWEHLMHDLVDRSAELAAECESLEKQLAAEDTDYKSHIENVKKLKDEKQRQHQALLTKIESVRVKKDLNSSKTTRKNFGAKVEELTADRDQKQETKRKLTQDLEEVDGKLKALAEERRSETLTWEKEIASLRQEMERLSRQAEESKQAALKDEIVALESQGELAVAQMEDWISEAERYMNNIRSDTSPQSSRHRLEWEKNVAMVRSSLGKLKSIYNEKLKQLHKGQQLDTLPNIPLPHLPHIPMIDLLNFTSCSAIPPLVTHPPFHSTHRTTPPLLSAQNPATITPHTLEQNTAFPSPAMPTTVCAPTRAFTYPVNTLPYTAVPMAQVSTPGSLVAAAGLSQGVGSIPSVRNSTSQALPPNPQPAGKLDKLLEILGAQFPQCTRTQIMGVLQQVKSERGTMAGMSIENIKQQVEQKLAQNERPPLGPIAPPASSRHSHRGPVQPPPLSTRPPVHAPGTPVFQSRGPQAAPPVRKLCLMCQNLVEPGTQYNTNCPHTLHRECISVWLQSSRNNNCPFCPSK